VPWAENAPVRVIPLVVALGALAFSPEAEAGSGLFVHSEKSEYIGQGAALALEGAGVTITATELAGAGVHVAVTSATQSWALDFAAPDGLPLAPGLYEGPVREGTQAAGEPGLDVSANGRGCNALTGRFIVYDVAYGAGDAIDAFAADFVQYCDGSPLALAGAIRVNASDAIPDFVDTDADGERDVTDVCPDAADPDQHDSDLDGTGDACDPHLEATFVLLDSPNGEYIGQAERWHWNVSNARIRARRNADGGVAFEIDENGATWNLDFVAPGGGAPEVGVYDGATRWPFNGPSEPGLQVIGAGRGCNVIEGSFEVLELALAENGDVLAFAADFAQVCEGFSPALHGSVRWRAAFRSAKKDLDGDGWLDAADNCRGVPNPAQWDLDGNGTGDDCGLAAPQQQCVNEMNKRGAAQAKLQGAAGLACLKNAAKGQTAKLGTPATAHACLANDVGGRLAAGAAALAAREAALCSPAPEFGYAGATAVDGAARAEGAALMEDLFGPDLDAALIPSAVNPAGAKCQEETAKRSQALLDALFKSTVARKKAVLAGKKVLAVTSAESLALDLVATLDADATGRIAKAEAALEAGIGKRCGGLPALADSFPGCEPSIPLELAHCAERSARCRFCRMLGAFDALALDCDLFDDGSADSSCATDG
jgi:hypothetical protein